MATEHVIVALKEATPKKNLPETRNNVWVVEENVIKPSNAIIPQYDPLEFDHIFDKLATNELIFDSVVHPLINATDQGYNSTIFAYGPAATGKWSMMEGNVDDAGIIPRTIEEIFNLACDESKSDHYLIRCSFFMIHYNKVYDLIRFLGDSVYINNLDNDQIVISAREAVISTKQQAFDIFNLGLRNRSLYVKKCRLNVKHCDMVFRFIIEHQLNAEATDLSCAHLNLVTLGGSERIERQPDHTKFSERDFLNRYLSMFTSMVIKTADKEPVSYGDSILTSLFSNCFGGNMKTAIIATFLKTSMENTNFTLNFAKKARIIGNSPIINITGTGSLLRQVFRETSAYYDDLSNIKAKCAKLNSLSQIMTEIELFRHKIKLLQLAFVRREDKPHDFGKLFVCMKELEFSNLELRLLNVLVANKAFAEIHVGREGKMPFEMLYGTLSNDVGNDFITPHPENFTETLLVENYIIATESECEPAIPHSDDETEGDLTPSFTDITSEYTALEKSIAKRVKSKELKAEIDSLSTIFHTTYFEQVAINHDLSVQNDNLRAEIAELKLKLSTQETEKCSICERLLALEKELNQTQQIVADSEVRKQYESLLLEIDKKDMEYIALQREKNELETIVKDLNKAIEKYKAPSHAYDKLESTDSNVALLQAELQILQQKVTDQDFIMEGMTTKYKRREEELVRRVQEKEAAQQRVFSTFRSVEKQVQASPRVEDTVAQTEDFTLGLDVSLQTDKQPLDNAHPQVELEDTEAQTEKSPTRDVSLQTEKRKVGPLQYYHTTTEISSMTDLSGDLGTADVNLTTTVSAPSTSAVEETTYDITTLTAEERECVNDLKKCQSVIDQNNTVIKNVKELHVLYARDISRRIRRDPRMHNKMRRKEEELFKVKTELYAVEEKLRDTKEELHKLKEKSISDRCLASKRVQTPQKMKGCLACEELADKIEELQQKLAEMKAADDTTKFRMNMEYHKMEMESLSRSSQQLENKFLELQEDYETVVKIIRAQEAARARDDPEAEQRPLSTHCEIG